MSRRVLPNNLEAESSVVGGIILHPKAFNDVAGLVDPQDFYHPTLEAIYQAMVDLDAAGKPIDQLTIVEQMRASDTYAKLRAYNGEAYFAELMTSVVTVENLAFHARMVNAKARARRLIEGLQEAAAAGYESGDPDDIATLAERVVLEHSHRSRGATVHIKTVVSEVVRDVEELSKRDDVVTGVPSGYPELDVMTAGFHEGELDIIAGRPAMGKTALVMGMVRAAAMGLDERPRVPGLVFSLEMKNKALVRRMLAGESGVLSQRLRTGKLDREDWRPMVKGASRLADLPIHLHDEGAITLAGIRSVARRWRADPRRGANLDASGRRGPALVVIDYLQLVAGSGGETKGRRRREADSREREVAEVSRGLKQLAKELDCPIIALSQLNRGVEGRADKRPTLGDLRESGQIEADADLICFVYRDEVYNKATPDQGIAEVIIAKQRDGAVGTVRLAFNADLVRFANLERHHEAQGTAHAAAQHPNAPDYPDDDEGGPP